MGFERREPEGPEVRPESLTLFSRVAGLTGRAAARRVTAVLGPAPAAETAALDVGTGPGTIPLHLKRHWGMNAHWVGLDISSAMLDRARSHAIRGRTNLSFAGGDGQCLPFRDASLDLVTCLFTLHHMDRPLDFFREVARILKPHGRFLLIDFRRDMSTVLFHMLNTLWRTAFFRSPGKTGFEESVRSAWTPGEIRSILGDEKPSRFSVGSNIMELWVVSKGREEKGGL